MKDVTWICNTSQGRLKSKEKDKGKEFKSITDGNKRCHNTFWNLSTGIYSATIVLFSYKSTYNNLQG